jgi:ribose transport system substrate-binding protein
MKAILAAAGVLASIAFGHTAFAQTKPTVPVIVKDMKSSFWQIVLAGARNAGADLGVDVVALGAQSESDADGQIGMLEKAVASKPAAIVIAPVEFAALGEPIDEAAKKIKIIGLESTADSRAMTSLLATDDVNAGRIAADALAAAITASYADTEGDIAVISSMHGIDGFDRRVMGFKEALAAKYRALAIVADEVADGDPTSVRNVMKDLIATRADLRGVFVSDPVMAHAVAQAISEKKSDDLINVVAMGSDDELVGLLQDGVIAGLVVEDPFRMGYEGVRTAVAASRGEPVPAYIDTGATLVTKANLKSARSQELLRPRIQ